MTPQVQIDSLSKRFKMYPRASGRLVEWISANRLTRHSDFWALRDFSLQVGQGECIGIIGPNGAGKSTLLKILSGALAPSEGSFQIRGRVLSLLELGTGFSPELTGRQNVVETASLLGFPGDYVQLRIKEIEAFAAIGDFFDKAIRIYSSGMTVRLAFAMFAFLQPDVFIVDEALAVGDVGFQRACYRKIEEMLARGVTCLMVTHDLSAIVQFCHRAVLLLNGEIAFAGDPREAVNRLNNIYFGIAGDSGAGETHGDGNARIGRIWFEDSSGQQISSAAAGAAVVFCHEVQFFVAVPEPAFGFHIKTTVGVEVTLVSSEKLGCVFTAVKAGETVVVRWSLDLTLNAGSYFFGCGVRYAHTETFLDRRVDAVKFPIADLLTVGGIVNPVRSVSVQSVGFIASATPTT